RGRLPLLRERFEALVRARLAPEDCVPHLTLDAEVRFSECDLGLADWLERLSPHGLGNAEPVFAARDVRVTNATSVGGGKHLRMTLDDATGTVEAIGFGYGPRCGEVARAGRCDVAFVPSRNEWMGESRVQLKLRGVRIP
ncbi:MAG: single-stranded-DNA-specific exonuclease RecJ, partial [Candidatus Eisenbacteria bacterium]